MSDRGHRHHPVSRPPRETREISDPQRRETRPRERGSQDQQAQSAPRSDSASRFRSPRSSRTDVHNQGQTPVLASFPQDYPVSRGDQRSRHEPQQAIGGRGLPSTATHSSQGISSASSPPNPLSIIAQKFVDIGMKEYSKCNDLLLENPELQSEPRDQFQRAAFSAIKQSDREYARQCLQAFVLLSGVDIHRRNKYFRMLADSKDERHAVTDNISTLYDALEKKAQTQTIRPDPTHRAGSQSTQAKYTGKRDSVNFDYAVDNMKAVTISSDSKGRSRAGQDNITQSLNVDSAADNRVSQLPTRRPYDPNKDARFKICRSDFFCLGRVFATLWASPEGQADSKASDWSRNEGGLHVTVRRMVVVRSRHGSSQCLAVTTHAGRGLSKHGLNDEDVKAHAIIHAEQDAPTYLTNEPQSKKNPIAVAVVQGQRLGKASRVCFSKIHTVEHNWKVMNIGEVTSACMDDFRAYVKAENQF